MDKVELEPETTLWNIIYDYISEEFENGIDTSNTNLTNEDVAIPDNTDIAGDLDTLLEGVTA